MSRDDIICPACKRLSGTTDNGKDERVIGCDNCGVEFDVCDADLINIEELERDFEVLVQRMFAENRAGHINPLSKAEDATWRDYWQFVGKVAE